MRQTFLQQIQVALLFLLLSFKWLTWWKGMRCSINRAQFYRISFRRNRRVKEILDLLCSYRQFGCWFGMKTIIKVVNSYSVFCLLLSLKKFTSYLVHVSLLHLLSLGKLMIIKRPSSFHLFLTEFPVVFLVNFICHYSILNFFFPEKRYPDWRLYKCRLWTRCYITYSFWKSIHPLHLKRKWIWFNSWFMNQINIYNQRGRIFKSSCKI